MATLELLTDCFTEEALAREANCSPRTIARYRKEKNGLPHFTLAGRVYIRRRDWEAWLERRIVRPNPGRGVV